MTDEELIQYYKNLLIMQYQNKPKASAHIAALVAMAIMNQLPKNIEKAFNIETAEGVQLDAIAKYQNVNRVSYDPIAEEFSQLNDDDFRKLIFFAVINNTFNSDLDSITSLFFDNFGLQVRVFDYEGMRMSYFIDTNIGSEELINAVIYQKLLPKPMGVTLAPTIYDDDLYSFFGFRTYTVNTSGITPFNSYTSYQMNRPWVSYENSVL